MTTLIIHPAIDVQIKHAYSLAGELIGKTITPEFATAYPDIHVLDGTEVTSIGIDLVRELIRSLQYFPYEAPVQIGMIIMANMLTEEAQNSLLKSLEEPTRHTTFIMTTPHEKFLLPTILSRSQKIYVPEMLIPGSGSDPQSKKTSRKAVRKPSGTDPTRFATLDLVDKLLFIDTLLEKDKETPGATMEFLAGLASTYRMQLLDATRRNDQTAGTESTQALRRINRAVHYISRNANKRLTLENLILHLENRIMQGPLRGRKLT